MPRSSDRRTPASFAAPRAFAQRSSSSSSSREGGRADGPSSRRGAGPRETAPSILDGAKIKALREARGMNQSVTAKLSGINQGNLSKIETGSRRVTRPSHATVVALAKTLGVKPSEICGEGAGDEDGAEAILARLLLVREAASMAVRADKMSQKERAALLRSLRSLCSVTDARNAARFVSSWLAMHRRIDTN